MYYINYLSSLSQITVGYDSWVGITIDANCDTNGATACTAAWADGDVFDETLVSGLRVASNDGGSGPHKGRWSPSGSFINDLSSNTNLDFVCEFTCP